MTLDRFHDETDPDRVGDFTTTGWTGDGAAVHPLASVGNTAEWIGHASKDRIRLGERTIVRAFVTIDRGAERPTKIGNDCLIMCHAHIGHDVQIGNHVRVAAGAVVGGCVTVGDNTMIGINAVVIPHKTIGTDVRVGAGAVVTRDIPDGEVWAGNPARRLLPLGEEWTEDG